MNCVESHELLQRGLDGDGAALAKEELAAHLALCPACRELHRAAQRLLDGLSHVAPPRPPADLAERICQQVLVERSRRRRWRRRLTTAALAASLLLLASAIYLAVQTGSRIPPSAALAERKHSPDSPSLHRHLEEAGLAVVALTRRTADETMDQTKFLLPVSLPDASLSDALALGQALESPAQSLRELQEGMSAGLEPVATSARRAVDLFWRELPQ